MSSRPTRPSAARKRRLQTSSSSDNGSGNSDTDNGSEIDDKKAKALPNAELSRAFKQERSMKVESDAEGNSAASDVVTVGSLVATKADRSRSEYRSRNAKGKGSSRTSDAAKRSKRRASVSDNERKPRAKDESITIRPAASKKALQSAQAVDVSDSSGEEAKVQVKQRKSIAALEDLNEATTSKFSKRRPFLDEQDISVSRSTKPNSDKAASKPGTKVGGSRQREYDSADESSQRKRKSERSIFAPPSSDEESQDARSKPKNIAHKATRPSSRPSFAKKQSSAAKVSPGSDKSSRRKSGISRTKSITKSATRDRPSRRPYAEQSDGSERARPLLQPELQSPGAGAHDSDDELASAYTSEHDDIEEEVVASTSKPVLAPPRSAVRGQAHTNGHANSPQRDAGAVSHDTLVLLRKAGKATKRGASAAEMDAPRRAQEDLAQERQAEAARARAEFAVETARLRLEADRLANERQRFEAVREELAAKRQEVAAKQDRLDAKEDEIKAQQAEIEREARRQNRRKSQSDDLAKQHRQELEAMRLEIEDAERELQAVRNEREKQAKLLKAEKAERAEAAFADTSSITKCGHTTSSAVASTSERTLGIKQNSDVNGSISQRAGSTKRRISKEAERQSKRRRVSEGRAPTVQSPASRPSSACRKGRPSRGDLSDDDEVAVAKSSYFVPSTKSAHKSRPNSDPSVQGRIIGGEQDNDNLYDSSILRKATSTKARARARNAQGAIHEDTLEVKARIPEPSTSESDEQRAIIEELDSAFRHREPDWYVDEEADTSVNASNVYAHSGRSSKAARGGRDPPLLAQNKLVHPDEQASEINESPRPSAGRKGKSRARSPRDEEQLRRSQINTVTDGVDHRVTQISPMVLDKADEQEGDEVVSHSPNSLSTMLLAVGRRSRSINAKADRGEPATRPSERYSDDDASLPPPFIAGDLIKRTSEDEQPNSVTKVISDYDMPEVAEEDGHSSFDNNRQLQDEDTHNFETAAEVPLPREVPAIMSQSKQDSAAGSQKSGIATSNSQPARKVKGVRKSTVSASLRRFRLPPAVSEHRSRSSALAAVGGDEHAVAKAQRLENARQLSNASHTQINMPTIDNALYPRRSRSSSRSVSYSEGQNEPHDIPVPSVDGTEDDDYLSAPGEVPRKVRISNGKPTSRDRGSEGQQEERRSPRSREEFSRRPRVSRDYAATRIPPEERSSDDPSNLASHASARSRPHRESSRITRRSLSPGNSADRRSESKSKSPDKGLVPSRTTGKRRQSAFKPFVNPRRSLADDFPQTSDEDEVVVAKSSTIGQPKPRASADQVQKRKEEAAQSAKEESVRVQKMIKQKRLGASASQDSQGSDVLVGEEPDDTIKQRPLSEIGGLSPSLGRERPVEINTTPSNGTVAESDSIMARRTWGRRADTGPRQPARGKQSDSPVPPVRETVDTTVDSSVPVEQPKDNNAAVYIEKTKLPPPETVIDELPQDNHTPTASIQRVAPDEIDVTSGIGQDLSDEVREAIDSAVAAALEVGDLAEEDMQTIEDASSNIVIEAAKLVTEGEAVMETTQTTSVMVSTEIETEVVEESEPAALAEESEPHHTDDIPSGADKPSETVQLGSHTIVMTAVTDEEVGVDGVQEDSRDVPTPPRPVVTDLDISSMSESGAYDDKEDAEAEAATNDTRASSSEGPEERGVHEESIELEEIIQEQGDREERLNAEELAVAASSDAGADSHEDRSDKVNGEAESSEDDSNASGTDDDGEVMTEDPFDEARLERWANALGDPADRRIIGEEGVSKLFGDDLKLDIQGPHPLLLAWRLDASDQGRLDKNDFIMLLADNEIDTSAKLREWLENLASTTFAVSAHTRFASGADDDSDRIAIKSVRVSNEYRSFWSFCFNALRDPATNCIATNLAENLWRVILAPHFEIGHDFVNYIGAGFSGSAELTRDVWDRILDFCQQVSLDDGALTGHTVGAWPDIVEQYCAWVLGGRQSPDVSREESADGVSEDISGEMLVDAATSV